MEDLEKRIRNAKDNPREAEKLLIDYIPFIKKQLIVINRMGLEYDDCYSIAMLAFVNSIRQYRFGEGNFLSFASLNIKHRLIDEARKSLKHQSKIVYFPEEEEKEKIEGRRSIDKYSREQERQSLEEEINRLSEELKKFGITFQEMTKVSPKQKRSREQCSKLARYIIQNVKMKDYLIESRKIAQAELASEFDISVKTIEKHRKYIVTIVILLLGDYPGIKAFLPHFREVD